MVEGGPVVGIHADNRDRATRCSPAVLAACWPERPVRRCVLMSIAMPGVSVDPCHRPIPTEPRGSGVSPGPGHPFRSGRTAPCCANVGDAGSSHRPPRPTGRAVNRQVAGRGPMPSTQCYTRSHNAAHSATVTRRRARDRPPTSGSLVQPNRGPNNSRTIGDGHTHRVVAGRTTHHQNRGLRLHRPPTPSPLPGQVGAGNNRAKVPEHSVLQRTCMW